MFILHSFIPIVFFPLEFINLICPLYFAQLICSLTHTLTQHLNIHSIWLKDYMYHQKISVVGFYTYQSCSFDVDMQVHLLTMFQSDISYETVIPNGDKLIIPLLFAQAKATEFIYFVSVY